MSEFSLQYYIDRQMTLDNTLNRAKNQTVLNPDTQEMYRICMSIKLLDIHQLFYYRPDVYEEIMRRLQELSFLSTLTNSDLALITKCFSIITTDRVIPPSDDSNNVLISQSGDAYIAIGRRRFEDFSYRELEDIII